MVGAKFTQFGAVDDSGLGFTRVDLGHGDVQTLSNIFNSFVTLGDDSDGLGNSLGSDRVITSNHDNLKAKSAKFRHSVDNILLEVVVLTNLLFNFVNRHAAALFQEI
jgi:hypothetical protein